MFVFFLDGFADLVVWCQIFLGLCWGDMVNGRQRG